jgi:hypothetical protein
LHAAEQQLVHAMANFGAPSMSQISLSIDQHHEIAAYFMAINRGGGRQI